jgi:mannose-6-phosphate isomerase-like protein (cupin superfamily)
MHRLALLILTCIILSAGCLAANPPEAPERERVQLLAPADGFPIFEGRATYMGILGDETPQIRSNYSMGHVIIPPGNATSPHRLVGTTELVYVISGAAEIRTQNGSVIAGEGATVLLPEGVRQSIASIGDADLHYITVIHPPFTSGIEVLENESAVPGTETDGAPIVVPDPREGIRWDSGTGAIVYTLVNPELMPEREIPVAYSVAYAELAPGGYLGYDRLNGSSDLIYVVSGDIEVSTPEGDILRVPAGFAAYVPPDTVKMSRNAAASVTTILSIVDPAWTEEKTGLWN